MKSNMDSMVARQPILDINKKTYAYELLFRSREMKKIDGNQATAQVIVNGLDIIGLSNLTHGKKAFINFTGDLIKEEIATILPPEMIAVEILEDVQVDDSIIMACRELKTLGYQLVLDDFIYHPGVIPLLEMIDIIKIDFLLTSPRDRDLLVNKIRRQHNPRVSFLAEKIETEKEFKEALDCGYDYFQGFFFMKPVTISGKPLPAYKVNYLNMLRELNREEPDFREIEKIIKQDISMSYSLLRLINSAAYGYKVDSIRQASVLLGIKRLKKWCSLYLMKGLGNNKPDVLLNTTLVRAKLAELLGTPFNIKDKELDLFAMGIFSMLDAFLDRPLENIMADISLSEEITEALLNHRGVFGDILLLIQCLEKGDWKRMIELEAKYHLKTAEISRCYLEAVAFGSETTAFLDAPDSSSPSPFSSNY